MLQELTFAELDLVSGGRITVVVKNSLNTVANTNYDCISLSAAVAAGTNNTVGITIGSSASGGIAVL